MMATTHRVIQQYSNDDIYNINYTSIKECLSENSLNTLKPLLVLTPSGQTLTSTFCWVKLRESNNHRVFSQNQVHIFTPCSQMAKLSYTTKPLMPGWISTLSTADSLRLSSRDSPCLTVITGSPLWVLHRPVAECSRLICL